MPPGGVPDLALLAPSVVEGEPSAYEGCVQELVVNKYKYDLSETGRTFHPFGVSIAVAWQGGGARALGAGFGGAPNQPSEPVFLA